MVEVPKTREFWADLLRRITKYSRDRGDAEDLLHAAFIRLERYSAEHTVENPKAFMIAAAANIAIDRYRREKLIVVEPIYDEHALFADSSPLQDEVIIARARLERVRQGIAKLSPRTREVLLMHRLGGLKQREVAARLGISQSAVEKHIAKAMLSLMEWAEGW